MCDAIENEAGGMGGKEGEVRKDEWGWQGGQDPDEKTSGAWRMSLTLT